MSRCCSHRATCALSLAGWLAGLVLAATLLITTTLSAQPAEPGPSAASSLPADPVGAAQELFDQGEYAKGLELLNTACRVKRRSHLEYARLLTKLAYFYEHYAGDPRRVRGYLREIRKLELAPDNPDVLAAEETAARLDRQAAQYRTEDQLLARVRVTRYDQATYQRRVVEITALIRDRPDYPRLAAAYHYLGENHLHLEQYRRAYRAFDKALELRPALGFSLPTPARRDRAFELWMRRDLSRGAWAALGGILLLASVLFFAGKPWRRLGLQHAQVLLFVVVLWWLFFRVAVWGFGASASLEPATFPAPVYLYSAVGSPMSDVLDTLFAYGLVGVVGAYLLAVGLSRYRPRWTWAVVTAAVTLLLFASLLTQFYLRHARVTFQPAAQGRYAHLRGTFYYSLTEDQDPFILTDPTAYCGFQKTIKDMDEPELQRWFKRYAEVCGPQ